MASYDGYVELDAVDAEADAKLGASEAALARCKGQCEPHLDCFDLEPTPTSHGTSGQSDEEHAADGDDREQEGGGRTKPSEWRHVLSARNSIYAATTRPLRPLRGCIVADNSSLGLDSY